MNCAGEGISLVGSHDPREDDSTEGEHGEPGDDKCHDSRDQPCAIRSGQHYYAEHGKCDSEEYCRFFGGGVNGIDIWLRRR